MKNSKIGLIIIAVIAVIAIILIGGYNSIISASEEVENKFSTIDTQLQRRADLIPNLVNTVKGYANQEKEIINTVTTARRDYNEAVKTYNLKIKKFPSNVMANMFGFGEKQYFEASEESKNVPNVQF